MASDLNSMASSLPGIISTFAPDAATDYASKVGSAYNMQYVCVESSTDTLSTYQG